MDVEQLMEKEDRELNEMANSRIPLPAKDLTWKDNDLISKMNMLAKAVEID